jgi:hypothetical protein
LAELSGQFGGKIWPLRKKFSPLGDFHSFEGICDDLDTKVIFVYVTGKSIMFLGLTKNYREQEVKIHFLEVRPLIAISVQNLPKFVSKIEKPIFLVCPFKEDYSISKIP